MKAPIFFVRMLKVPEEQERNASYCSSHRMLLHVLPGQLYSGSVEVQFEAKILHLFDGFNA